MSAIFRARERYAAKAAAVILATALPVGCVAPPPANPFAGTWSTTERQQIAFRDDTIVVSPPDAPPTPMSAASCDGAFRFGYQHESREALLGLAARQPDVWKRLAPLLVQPDYSVAELGCGAGDSTYVLLDDSDLVVIHRDRDIAGIERLSRL